MTAPSLVLAWCDDLYLLGHQASDWITDYVDVEESLAMGSIAQDHLAHAAALLGTCGFSAADRDRLIYERPASEWFPSLVSFIPPRDWPATVARQFLFNRATLVLRRHLEFSDRPRLQQLAEIISAEQDVHATHWERWLRIFAADEELSHEMAGRLTAAAGDAADLFGLPEGSEPDGLLVGATPAQMQRQWAQEVATVLQEVGLAVPALPVEPAHRTAGDTRPPLEGILAQVRSCRGPGGAREYEIYR